MEQVWYYECIVWCLYQVVFFFIFCKDGSEMLYMAFEKAIEFFHDVLLRNVTAAPPPPNEHMTFLVNKIDMCLRLPLQFVLLNMWEFPLPFETFEQMLEA